MPDGIDDGSELGRMLGTLLGETLGFALGWNEGLLEGTGLGTLLGDELGMGIKSQLLSKIKVSSPSTWATCHRKPSPCCKWASTAFSGTSKSLKSFGPVLWQITTLDAAKDRALSLHGAGPGMHTYPK